LIGTVHFGGEKIFKKTIIVLAILFVFVNDGEAQRRRGKDPFQKFQTGFWFGPITPVHTTADDVDTSLGGGAFIRSNSFFDSFKIGVESSYHFFESRGVNTLTLWPVYGNLLYRIPVKFPIIFQLKAGAGGSWVKIRPDREDQWDPLFTIGFEGSFPAGKVINIGLRIDYLLIYEKHIEGARRNGHIIDTGITLFFNLF
jgi:hypothetical protein